MSIRLHSIFNCRLWLWLLLLLQIFVSLCYLFCFALIKAITVFVIPSTHFIVYFFSRKMCNFDWIGPNLLKSFKIFKQKINRHLALSLEISSRFVPHWWFKFRNWNWNRPYKTVCSFDLIFILFASYFFLQKNKYIREWIEQSNKSTREKSNVWGNTHEKNKIFVPNHSPKNVEKFTMFTHKRACLCSKYLSLHQIQKLTSIKIFNFIEHTHTHSTHTNRNPV